MLPFFVVTPTYNSEAFLEETIESVVSQSVDVPLRYHIQDGGSSDGTLAIVQKWEKALKGNPAVSFSYASEKDGGMYDAINKAFASLDIPPDAFMGWINSDDLLFPGALRAVAGASRNATVDWVYGLPCLMDADGNERKNLEAVYHPQAFLAAGLGDGIHWFFVQQEGCFFRKRLWDAMGGCDTNFRLAGDWDLWRRMAAIRPPVQISCKIGGFRSRPGQLSEDLSGYLAEIERNLPLHARRAIMRNYALLHRLPALRLEPGGDLVTVPFPLKARTRCLMLGMGLNGAVRLVQHILRGLRRLRGVDRPCAPSS